MARKAKVEEIRCGVIGYGAAFNMGRAHADWITKTEGMRLVAVCDIDPSRTEAAKADFPWISTYNDLDEMLEKEKMDLAVVVTPHNTHAPIALKCLRAGKHVVVEKPMCITVKEATEMIEEARKAKRMLSVFHNRRWDGDYIAIKRVVEKGLIGKVFHVEMFGGGYGHPGYWWRSDKKISGGAFYDWGAHYIDWLLGIVKERMVSVTGFFHKYVWNDVTNEDQVHAVIRFESGAVADIQFSSIARAGKPRWRILGTKGAIVDQGGGSFRLITDVDGVVVDGEVKYERGDWSQYYKNVAAHILHGEPLAVKPEEARRVIAVMETAEISSRTGKSEPVPFE
jgi:predicted dehydrogenase